MRQFLIAFVCLSTIAMAQTVVVATPLSADPVPAMSANSEANSSAFVPSAAPLGGKVQEPATMMLLVLGLSGLTAVSGSNHAGKKRVSP